MSSLRFASHTSFVIAVLSLCLGTTDCSDSDAGGANSSAGAGQTSAGAKGSSAGDQSSSAGEANAAAGAQSSGAGAPDSSAGADGEAGAGPTDDIPDRNGCGAADYEDQSGANATRIIGIATMGLSFTPKCLTIHAGQTVRWEGSLATHPLAPGNPDDPAAGSADSPIVETLGGQSVEFTFATPGTFPYYCEVHSFGSGMGMAGVVHVAP